MDGRARTTPVASAAEGDILYERGQEVDALRASLDAAAAGTSRLTLIEGPPGIGKSRLLDQARDAARRDGFRVLSARGSDLERGLPFGVVRQLFEQPLAGHDDRARWLVGSAQAAAAVFEPPGEPARGEAGDASFTALHGLYWLTANIAVESPVMLAIDDLQWCDRASLRFLAYLVPRLDDLPLLVAAALRTGEPGADARLVAELAHDPVALVMRPRPLTVAAVGELVAERLGGEAEAPFSEACHRATGGNPLLLGELLKTFASEGIRPDAAHAGMITDLGPRAVSRTVLLRLARLPADATLVARAVAVLGEAVDLRDIATLSGLDDGEVADGARALVAAEILRPEPPLGFVHPLVREAVYHDLAPGERELHHRRAARALAEAGATPEQVAPHLLRAPRSREPWAAELLQDAARSALRRGAPESAVACLERALEEPIPEQRRPELLLELGLTEALMSGPRSTEHIRAALDGLVDPAQRAMAAEVLARSLIFTRPPEEAVAVAREAAAALGADHADRRHALEAVELYAVAFGARVPDAAERLARFRAGGARADVGARMLTAVAAWDHALRGGPAAECAELALAALEGGALIAADPGFMTVVAVGVLVLADRDEALDAWGATMAEARRQGSLLAICGVHLWRGWTWLRRGELIEAEASLREAIDETLIWEGSETAAGTPYNVAFLARVLIERGDLSAARAVLAERGTPEPGSDGDTLARRSDVELLLAERRWHDALEAAVDYHARLPAAENPAWAPWRSLQARALAGLDRHDEARDLLEDELDAARRWGAPGALARTLRGLGAAKGDAGIELLEEAVAISDRPAVRLEHAKALAALGSAMRRARRPVEAREPLRRALETAARCGAEPLAAHARAELYVAGGRPRRVALTGPESLTPSERRVVELAAEGRSNREIAQDLFVTAKTVEVHLTNAYRKLGIRGRGELAAAVAGSG